MASIRFYLDIRRLRGDGTAPLKLVFRHQRRQRLFSLDMSLRPADWDKRRSRLKAGAYKAGILNARLDRIASETNIEINLLQSDRISTKIKFEEFENAISCYLYGQPIVGATVANRFVDYASRCRRASTADLYLFTLRLLRQYCRNFDELTFADINRDWIMQWRAWLGSRSKSPNYWNIQLRNLRTIFNDAIASDLTQNYPFKNITLKAAPTKKRSFTAEQLRVLFDYPCQNYLRPYVDMFKLMFFLCGINLIDLFELQEINGGRVEFNRRKTDRPYDIKVEPEALQIIKRYRGKSALLELADRYQDHRNYTHRINKNLKKIGPTKFGKRKKVERIEALFPSISTYWARHSWATIAAELDIPDSTISLALGHSENQNVTDIYILRNRTKVDEANRKVMDWVLYGIKDGIQVVKPGSREFYGDMADVMDQSSVIG